MAARDVPESGFTLLELLVAMALAAIISAILLNGISSTHRLWTHVQRFHVAEEIETGAQRLREMLSTARVAYVADATDRPARLLFDGRPDELTFVTLSEGYAFQGGLMRVRLSQAPSTDEPNGRSVLLHTAVFRANAAAMTDVPPPSVFRSIISFQLRYFGRANPGEPLKWRSDWLGKKYLPRLIEAQLTFRDGAQVREIELPVELRHAAQDETY